MSQFNSTRQTLKQRLHELWAFRYNTILGRVEFGQKDANTYEPMTDYELNNIIDCLDRTYGKEYKPDALFSVLRSEFSEKYNPICLYFDQIGQKHPDYDAQDNIIALCKTVKCIAIDDDIAINPNEAFEIALSKWLVASVANVFNSLKCENHTCIVLTGGMGAYKSTWLNNLCPPALAKFYHYEGKINLNPENKDVLVMLGEKFTVNLDDQLRNLFKKDSETMKTFLSQNTVSIRRSYARFSEDIPRIANFIASINGEDFLAENENRRFLPFKVASIDWEATQKIDMDKVWAEAYHLYKSQKFQWWWTKQELAECFGDMKLFQQPSVELEMLLTYFEIAKERYEAHTAMTQADVINYLRTFTKEPLSTKKLSEAMKKASVIRYSKRLGGGVPMYVFALRKKNINSIDSEQNVEATDGSQKEIF